MSFDVTFVPTSGSSISNQAVGAGTGQASLVTATSTSTVGTNPTDPTNPTGPTPTGPISLNPSTAAAKSVAPLVDNGDGTFTASYTIAVVNDGNEALTAVQISDDLASAFPAGYSVANLTSPTLTVNAGFDGGANQSLLAGSDTLAVGASGQVTFDVTFTPVSAASIDNQATASGTGVASGNPTSALTTVGTDPTDPTNPTGPTPTGPIAVVPSVGAAKALDSITDNGDGTFTATYTIAIVNNGNELLDTVQITDVLVPNFPAGYVVSGPVSSDFTVNPGFNGFADIKLLTGTDSLAIGEQGSVSFAVTYTPTSQASIDNQATASGTGHASGSPASAVSTVGTDPTDPTNPTGPTPTGPIVVTPIIGAAKVVSNIVDNGDGSFTTTIGFVVENFGTEALTGIQLQDDLVSSFPPGYTVDSITSVQLTVNPGFDGDGDQMLLTGTDTLAVGATATLELVTTFVPTATAITNQAIATGTGAVSANPTTDLSDAGSDPDGNGNGNPDEGSENERTPIIPNLNPQILTAKSVDSFVDNGDGTFTTSYTVTIANEGNELLDNVQIVDDLTGNYPAGFTIGAPTSASLTVNPSFDGAGNANLLAGTDTLAVGDQAAVSFTVTFVPTSANSIGNQAVGSATGNASLLTTASPSTIGTDPTDPTNPTGPTPTGPINVVPEATVTKTVDAVVDNGDGTFTTSYTVNFANLGNEPLASVQIVDDLSATYPAGFAVANVTGSGLTANAGFDGAADVRLLDGSDSLAVGATGSVSFDVTFVPTSASSIDNTVDSTATGATSGSPTIDTSTIGTGPIGVVPSTVAAKSIDSFADNGDGTFTASYTIVVANNGNEALNGVQLSDDLATNYPAGYTVSGLTSADLTINPAFDGGATPNLLAGTDSLAVGATGSVSFEVTFVPTSVDPIANRGQASGTGAASGAVATDLTTVGTDPTDPTNVAGPTMTPSIPLVPGSTIAKTVDSLTDNGDGSVTTSYSIVVTNTGNEALAGVQVSDNLASNYPSGYVVSNLSSATLSTDPGFDGNGSTNLLTGTDGLAVGTSATITFDVTFIPTSTTAIGNDATVDAVGAASTTPTTATSSAATAGIPLVPGVATAKSLGSLVDNGNGSFTATFAITVANNGNEALTSVQATDNLAAVFPAGYVVDSVTSADFAVNPAFDGGATATLLDGTDTLGFGASGTVSVVVTFTPTSTSSITNTATGSAIGAVSAAPATDDGTASTGAILVLPGVATAKALTGMTDNGDGTFTTSYTVSVGNLGNEALTGVQITDSLGGNYPAGYSVSGITSPTLTINGSFDGDADQNLLAGSDSLAVGAQASVSFDVTFTPTSTASIDNSATANAIGAASGSPATDVSSIGTDPTDPTNPTGPVPTGPIPVVPAAAAAKSVTPLTDNGDGTFTADYTVTIANTGNETLTSVQVTDDLATNFAPGYVVSGISSADLSANPSFNGGADQNLLDGTDSLAVGAQGTVQFSVTFTPVSASSIDNQAEVTGTGGVTGTPTSAVSTVGTDPTDPTNPTGPTPTGPLAVAPGAAAAKAVAPLVDNGDGTFTASYTVTIANTGNEVLNSVQITDNLAVDFPAGFVVTNLVSPNLTVNPAFNGSGDTSLLTGTDSLALAEQGAVSFDVTFTPVSTSPINNQAIVSGSGAASGTPTSATSTIGTDPTDPTNPTGPTPTDPIAVTPLVGAAKTVSNLVDNGDGSFTVTMTFVVENFGNEALTNIQLEDDLVTGFPAGYVVNSVSSGSLTVNPAFDGDGDQLLLAGTDQLAIGATASVDVVATFVPTSTPIVNQAMATGSGVVSGNPTSDLSDAGSDPDGNGNGNPDEATENEPTPVIPNLNPQVLTAKSVDSLVDNGDGSFTTTYTVTIANDGNELLNAVQIIDDLVTNYPAGYTVGAPTSADLTVNPAFDGNVDQNLLAGTDSIAIGDQASVSFTVTFVPTAAASIDNQAIASATGNASLVTTASPSTTGTNPTDPTNPTGPTPTGPINVVSDMSVSKTVDSLVDNGDGSFTATYTVTVTNAGNEALASVQVTDDLAATFPAGYTVSTPTSTGLTPNVAFDGAGEKNLLSGSDSLAVTASGSVTFGVTFVPVSPASIDNTVDAGGTGATSGSPASATATVGSGPIAVVPSTVAAKSIAGFVDNGDGTFTTSYTIVVANNGNEALNNVQIVDDLATNYPAGYTVANPASADLSVNPAFDGGGDQNLLAGTDSLAVGATGTVSFDVTFVPTSSASIANRGRASGTGAASGTVTTDLTTIGTDPTDPTNPVGPTMTPAIPLVPSVAVAKSFDQLVDNGDGTFTVDYSVVIENTGNESLAGVQVVDDLASNFPGGYTVSGLTSLTLGVDPAFDGNTSQNLLLGSDSLAVGDRGTIKFSVTFLPASTASIGNQAVASATGAASSAGDGHLDRRDRSGRSSEPYWSDTDWSDSGRRHHWRCEVGGCAHRQW
ncbi:MAG: hypothetical protein R2706_09715 [Acidimicrobiales bacterium]